MMSESDYRPMIRDAIRELGFTHQQAARVFGVSYATVHAWLTGLRSPSDRSLQRIADGLDAYGDAVHVTAQQLRARIGGPR